MRVQWIANDVILWGEGGDRPITAGDVFIMPDAEARDRARAGQLVCLPDEYAAEPAAVDVDEPPVAWVTPEAVGAAEEDPLTGRRSGRKR